MRLFLAIQFEPTLRRVLHDATAPLRAVAPHSGWVAEDRLHLTLKFLGEQPEALVPSLTALMDDIAARHWPIPIAFRGVGAFPNLRRPRVVWIGVVPSPKLELLQHDVEAGCASLGLEVDGKPFRPHLTIGRLRGLAERDTLRELGRTARDVRVRAETVAAAIDLVHSTLTTNGRRYARIAQAPFRSS